MKDCNSDHYDSDGDYSESGSETYGLPSSVREYEELETFLETVVIFLDDLEPGHGSCMHTPEPPEWVLWNTMSEFGKIIHVTSMEPDSSSDGRVCFVVYAEASSALAAHKIFKNHDMEGEFVRMKPGYVPLAIYSTLLSKALHGSHNALKLHASCKLDPCYRPDTNTSCGYLAPNFQVLEQIAPPVPGDAMNRLFFPRTFTELQGHAEGAIVLSPGEQPPNPFADDSYDYYDDDPYDHLAPPNDPWPMEKQPNEQVTECMKSQITHSLLEGETETVLSPTIEELALRQKRIKEPKVKAQTSGKAQASGKVQASGKSQTSVPPSRLKFPAPRLESYDPQSVIAIESPIKGSKRSIWKIYDLLAVFGNISYIIGHEKNRASCHEYYVAFKDSTSAAKAYNDLVSSKTYNLRPRGSVPVEYGSWLSRLFADVRYKRPDESQWLALLMPSYTRGQQFECSAKGISDPSALPKPIPPLLQAVIPSDQPPNPSAPPTSTQHDISTCPLSSIQGVDAANHSPVSCGQSLQHLLFPDGCLHPAESQMFGASQLLAKLELDFAAKRPDTVQHASILNVLNRAASLPANWIPDNDLYNIQRRACKLVAMTSTDPSAPPSIAPPIGDSPSANAASVQRDKRLSVPLPEPPVKQESFNPATLSLPQCQEPTATKRRFEGNDANTSGAESQPPKRGRFSPDHDA